MTEIPLSRGSGNRKAARGLFGLKPEAPALLFLAFVPFPLPGLTVQVQGVPSTSTCLTLPLCVCARVGADITVLREREVDYDSDVPRKITEVLVRKVPDNQQVGT